jgi:putative peptide zinc metalloprotease protein
MSARPASPAAGRTRVQLRPLSVRQDGDHWVLGRVETGEFISASATAYRAITLLGTGMAVSEATQRLFAETGIRYAVANLVSELDGLGFVASIDGVTTHDSPLPQPSLRWLRPEHVRWTLHPLLPWAIGVLGTAGSIMLVLHHALIPGYRALVWNPHAGLVIAVNAAIAWVIIALHEFAHLATARAVGVPARISLSTRLQFLAAQTDVTGIWAAPRRTRLTVYLAGMAVNVAIASACVLVLGLASPVGLTRGLIATAGLESAIMLPPQLLVFMRTDVYFVIQDLSGCCNLYADATARIRYIAQRALGRVDRISSDPASALSPRERRAVRAYAWLLVFGTVASLCAALIITLPAIFSLLARAIGEAVTGSPGQVIDGATAIVIVGGFEIVWARSWWRRHGDRVLRWIRRWPTTQAEG